MSTVRRHGNQAYRHMCQHRKESTRDAKGRPVRWSIASDLLVRSTTTVLRLLPEDCRLKSAEQALALVGPLLTDAIFQ
jgi:hypothetical protein